MDGRESSAAGSEGESHEDSFIIVEKLDKGDLDEKRN